jgi:Acetyltransferase (GNAT) domain
MTRQDGKVLEIVESLRTQRLVLRPFTDADLDDVLAYHSLPEVVRYLYWGVRDRDQVRELLEQRRERYRLATEGDVATLAVVLPETGRVIGEVNLHWVSVVNRQGSSASSSTLTSTATATRPSQPPGCSTSPSTRSGCTASMAAPTGRTPRQPV